MNSHEPKPTLPTWIFVVTDLALIGAAAVIAYRSSQPLSGGAMIAIFACVGLGAVVGLVPLIAHFERQKNAMLDDRQRALEALARTVSSSAEQISIATGSLHEISEVAQKILRQAEHLPHKLQEKIAEFQAQLAAANDAEKEELEKELTALRTTESERLELISGKIAKSTAEWAKLEAGTARHLTAANEQLAKLPAEVNEAFGKAQGTAVQALAGAQTAAVRALNEAAGEGARVIGAAQAAALAALAARLEQIDAHLATATTRSLERISHDLDARLSAISANLGEKIVRLEAIARPLEAPPAPAAAAAAGANEPAPPAELPPIEAPAPAADEAPPPAATGSETTAVVPPVEASPTPPKRPRRSRRTGPTDSGGPSAAAATSGSTEGPVAGEPAIVSPPVDEPMPVPAERIAEVVPVAPPTADPFVTPDLDRPAPAGSADVSLPVAAAAPQPAATETAAGPPRKRTARRPAREPVPTLDLPLEEPATGALPGAVERTLTSDGATRLLATAYIGIGNRLFIRGEGPGLSWEKGVPLQFVSIGKWRWETNEASAPVQFKLYKNDEQECTALGQQTLEPGHLQEMTAVF